MTCRVCAGAVREEAKRACAALGVRNIVDRVCAGRGGHYLIRNRKGTGIERGQRETLARLITTPTISE